MSLSVDVDLDIKNIPAITINPLQINANLSPLTLTLNPVTISLKPVTVTITPIDFTLRVKEIPSVRVHLPVDYGICVGLFGVELLSVHLCGQAQVITEPYVPNPCECRPEMRLVPGTIETIPVSNLAQ